MACDLETTTSAVHAVVAAITGHREELTELDRRIGDGDHGENLARGFQAVVDRLAAESPGSPGGLLKLVATTLIATVGGASGPLFGTGFLRAATVVGDAETLDGPTIFAALAAARDGVAGRGKAEPGDKTMVDALTPAVLAAQGVADAGGDPAAVLSAAARAAAEGAVRTTQLQARKGRASYLGERSKGTPDPGATSVSYMLQALADVAC